jgi:TolB protein
VPASHATFPGRNGLILFQAQAGKHVQLFTVRADGTGVRQLTRFADGDSQHGSWSPDGSQIVFEHGGLAVIAADGTGFRQVLKGLNGTPAFSPDHKWIAFERTQAHDDALWLVRPDGSGLRPVTRNLTTRRFACPCDSDPQFSPDGKRLSFVRTLSELKTAVWVVGVDGTGLRQVTPWSLGVSAKQDWSPDGSRLVISSPQAEKPGTASNVFTVRPDGTGLTQLTHETKAGVHDLADSFSPDGTRIIYARNVGGGEGGFQVWEMKEDGSAQHQLTHGVDAHWASWGSHR